MENKKYSENFERDYNWYLKYKDKFTFDGTEDMYIWGSVESKIKPKIITDLENGKSAKECFYKYDSTGKVIPTKEPELLYRIFKCKGSINFNIKMWAEDRAKGYLPKIIFSGHSIESYIENGEIKYKHIVKEEDYNKCMVKELELLPWMVNAVERQKTKYYDI